MPFRKVERAPSFDQRLAGVDVLLVEDSKTYVAALRQRLEKDYGMRVTHCDSLHALTTVLREDPERYMIALIDLNLPGAPSGEALDYVLSMGIPAIVFTATFSEKTREAILAKQVADYVMKDGPQAIGRLCDAAVRVLTNREAHVLVVDDSPAMRDMVGGLLLRQLYRVTMVGTGEEALNALTSNPDIDLVITDYHMEGMSGIDLVHEVRSRPEWERIRIIGISSLEDRTLTARFLKAGANDFLHRPFMMEEFHWRVAQNVITILNTRRLREMAAQDYLTGIYNRRHFFDAGPRKLASGRKLGRPQSVALIDIDHFKKVNDTYGHEIGDVVLQGVARRLKALCGRDHLLSRLGGEEFGVILSGLPFKQARAFCDMIRKDIEALDIETDDGKLKVTVSIGLAEIASEETYDNYLNAADQFLYMAKAAGRNQVYSESDIGKVGVAA